MEFVQNFTDIDDKMINKANELGITVKELVMDSALQAKGMKMVADRVDSSAAVSMMDLSVEAEAFGAQSRFREGFDPLSRIAAEGERPQPPFGPPPQGEGASEGSLLAAAPAEDGEDKN